MKHIYLLLFMLIPMAGMAQEGISQDTTLYVNGRKILIKENEGKIKVKLYEQSSHGDTIENDQIFEGIYTDGQTTERRTAFTVLFVKRKNHYRFDPHIAGFYMGYTRLSDGINFNTPDGLNINANKSWEIGFNLFQGSLTLSRDRQWGITTGLGWGYRSFRLGNNYAFRQIEGVTGIVPGVPDEEVYTKSRLRYFYFRIPVALEWQKRFSHSNAHGPLFFSAGLEAEIRHGAKSKAKVNGHKKNLDSGLNIHPVGINLLAQAGYGDIGVYLRYSTYSLFEHKKGPELYPYSFGLCWYW